MGYIGDVNSHLIIAVIECANRKCVVKVLGILRVDGKCGDSAHIAAFCYHIGGDAGIDFISRKHNILGIDVWQPELGKYGILFRVIIAGLTENVNNLAYRAVGIVGPLDNACYRLVAGVSAFEFILGNENIGCEKLGIGYKVGEIFLHL